MCPRTSYVRAMCNSQSSLWCSCRTNRSSETWTLQTQDQFYPKDDIVPSAKILNVRRLQPHGAILVGPEVERLVLIKCYPLIAMLPCTLLQSSQRDPRSPLSFETLWSLSP